MKIYLNIFKVKKRAAYSSGRRGNEDPQLHDLVLSLQGRTISHILHPTVMMRLVDSSQYGNTYMPDEVLSDLFDQNVSLVIHLDSSLLGGVVIEANGIRLDASISGTLNRLSHYMKGAL